MLGIRGKILTISVSVVVLGIGIGTFLNGRSFRREYSESLYSEAKVIAQNLRAQLDRIRALGLDVDDIKGFEKQCLDVTREYPKLSYAAVVRGDGTILFHSDPTLHGTSLKYTEWLTSMTSSEVSVHTCRDESGEEFSHVAVPSDPDDHGKVYVVVGFPLRLISLKVRELVVKAILFASVSAGLATLLLLVSITFSVARPLSKLVGTIREIRTGGDLQKRVNIHSKDEIGTLAASFNEMISSLQQAHDELEDRVAQRTEELAEANQALTESEERFRLVVEKTGQVIYDHDVPSGDIRWAGAIEEVTGFTPEEFAQFGIKHWEETIHPEDRPRVLEYLNQMLEHSTSFDAPYRFRRKNGGYLHVEDRAVILRNSQGQAYRMLGAMKDITLRKMAEDELKRSHELLEQRVQERTVELVKANDQIRQAQADLVQAEKMGMLGQLVAGVAHEINTPTGAIMNIANDTGTHLQDLAAAAVNLGQLPEDLRRWLADAVPGILSHKANFSETMDRQARREIEQDIERQGLADPRRVAEILIDCGLTASDANAVRCLSHEAGLKYLEHLIALRVGAEISLISVQKIAKIVRALRYYSRTGEGDVFDINLNESLDNTLVILQNRIKRLAKVERHYEEKIPPVRCGPDISQIWTNILCNACDAIESAGQGEGLIRITTATKEPQAVVEIFNGGPPIPQEVMPRIFDPFFTTKPIGKGTGLGLSICVGVLRKYHGTITARNDPGGVTFEVTLPLCRAETGGEEKVSQGAEQQASRASPS